MNAYESRRLERIRRNQALLAQLDIKPLHPRASGGGDGKPKAERRRLVTRASRRRSSARIAGLGGKADYHGGGGGGRGKEEGVGASGSVRRRTGAKSTERAAALASSPDGPSVLAQDLDAIVAAWTAWSPAAPGPTRDSDNVFHFADYPAFLPNKSPSEVLREGAFGGSYYRPLRSGKLGIVVRDDWEELPADWIEGLDSDKFLTNRGYDADVNKFKVSCGQSIEEWEAAGWIDHAYDVRGWFQWYTRFFRGRRCEDDERQVGRWARCVGEKGRWRRMLVKKYGQVGVREVFDDGEDDGAPEVSPRVHQTCHHWAFELRQGHLDDFWAAGGV